MGLAFGDVTRVEIIYVDDFNFLEPLLDEEEVPLTAGGPENGDGAIFQVGYFQDVPALLNPESYGEAEWEMFRPLTGVGSPNAERYPTSIGGYDSNATGPFGFLFYPSAVAIEFDPALDEGLPDQYPARLGVRFFSGTTLEGSEAYNIVTSDDLLWLLGAPEASPSGGSALNMDEHTLFWASGPSGAFQTSMMLIPEPGSPNCQNHP